MLCTLLLTPSSLHCPSVSLPHAWRVVHRIPSQDKNTASIFTPDPEYSVKIPCTKEWEVKVEAGMKDGGLEHLEKMGEGGYCSN